ncbi:MULTISPECIES: hypothetical protein [Vibrio]|uniref:hypothetical protein n=1 Tax=Vibrio TaxID=662 RepID=UPI002074CB32|nr:MULTISPECIES: hypothetical protein [Vibrio]USD35458.1 hypothetical protein J8Z27_22830 [Vibrio sp. SCSIO 43186]USD72582.1 hypothetical protein J4N41_22835 [Vibrio sp. SCSIO 43139]USD98975.1 hypothetical protein CTT30_23155 [Vibrio coralliilyticus]
MKTLELHVYGIIISYNSEDDKKGCAISTDLKELPETEENAEFNCAVDGIESMILGHFAAGIDVKCEAYLEGLETAYNAVSAQFS